MLPAPGFFQHSEPLRRFARSVWKRYARLFKGPYFVERRMGAYWLLDQHNIIDRVLFCTGAWEQEQVAELTERTRKMAEGGARPIFLDIGSHAGFYAVLMAKTGLFRRVAAFEPMPAHLGQLQANLLLNDLSRDVEVHALALSNQAGSLRFAPGPSSNRGTAHTIDGVSTGLLMATPAADIVEVKACRLDDIFHERGEYAVIKIDVEGHEEATLTGMTDFLNANQCILQVEILAAAQERVSRLLESLGYRHLRSIGFDHYFSNLPAETAA